ncbi:unnamed protein product [Urochloa humidicola]
MALLSPFPSRCARQRHSSFSVEEMGSSDARRRRRQWTLALVTAAALLERADESLLPAVYREVGAALGASPTALGSLTLCRAIVQALCYPLATCAAARHDRARVVAAGAFLWAVATLLVGASGTFLQMALARGFNGVGLALVVPAIYSLVADYSDDGTRGGLAFGWVVMAQFLGNIAGNSLGVLLASTSFLGVPGWRLAFHVLALISASLAALTWLLGADPRPGTGKSTATVAAALAQLFREAKDVVRVPTFQIIVAQGVAGSVPWSALSFAAMWLELVGFTHWQTTLITNLNCLANMLGALFAGFFGDPLARRFPDTGRIALAQVCTASTVPLAAVLLLGLPDDPAAGAAYAARIFRLGFRHALVPRFHQQPDFRGGRTGEGEDDGVRNGQVLRVGVRVVRAAAGGHPGGARVRVPAGGVRHGRGRRQAAGERRRAGKGRVRGDRRADHRLLPHVLGAVLDLPRGQAALQDGRTAGGRGRPGLRL